MLVKPGENNLETLFNRINIVKVKAKLGNEELQVKFFFSNRNHFFYKSNYHGVDNVAFNGPTIKRAAV
jgi:hypothetical protein